MNIIAKYTLSETDYLTYQLYYASKSGGLKKARRKSLLYMVLMAVIFSMFPDKEKETYVAAVLIIFALAFILSLFRLKNTYKKLYLKHIRAVYKNDFGTTTELTFIDETIEAITTTGTISTLISQIVEISEIEKYWFLHLQTFGKVFVIPKEKLQNPDETGSAIKEISNRFNIKYNVDLKWKWR